MWKSPLERNPEKQVEWMGPEVCHCNRGLVAGKPVYSEKDISETDEHGRVLKYVFLASRICVNSGLVRRAYAQVSTYPPDLRYQDVFLTSQREAREEDRGLWGPTPILRTWTPLSPTEDPTTDTPIPATQVPPTQTEIPPTPTLIPSTKPSAAPGDVQTRYMLYYGGEVPQVESAEYAVIKNIGGSPVNLSGWRLNADDPGQDFWFPNLELQPGQECRVYTNEVHPESCGFNFGHTGSALWANSGECGHLYDSSGAEVSTYCY